MEWCMRWDRGKGLWVTSVFEEFEDCPADLKTRL